MPTSKLPASVRAFQHRNYRLFFAGQLIAVCGTWMQSVAQSWLVYRLTGSAALLGLVNFANLIPVFLLSPVGGATADRHSRHRIIVITQIVAMVLAFVLAALTLTGRIQVWHLFVLASLPGINYAFFLPAQSAFVVDMVGKEDLMNAIALNFSLVNGARIIGPAVAGLLVATIGEGWCFFLNGVCHIAVIGGLMLMNITPHRRMAWSGSPLRDVFDGFVFVARSGPVRALLLLLGAVSLFGVPYTVLMPIFAEQTLHHDASALGLMMGASGVGALGAAFSLAARKQLRGLGHWVALAAGGFGLSLILFSLSRSFWLSAALLVPVGYAMMIERAASNTLIQAMVPDDLRGRVMAVYSMMFMGMAPIGALFAGSLAQHFGAPQTVMFGGSICMLSAVAFALRLPRRREEGRRIIIPLQMSPALPGDEISETSILASTD